MVVEMVENKIEYKPTTSITLFNAVTMLTDAWEATKSSLISNCFRHVGFFKAKCSTESTEPAESIDLVSKTLIEQSNEFDSLGTTLAFDEYVMADQHVPTSEPLSEDPVVIENSIQIDADAEVLDQDEETDSKAYNRTDVLLSLDLLKSFAAQSFDSNYTQMCIGLINNVEKALIQNAPVKLVQRKL